MFYPRMADDLRRINGKLEENFKILATYMTDIKMNEYDKDPKDPSFERCFPVDNKPATF